MQKAKWTAKLGPYNDESTSLCTWHLPATHELESWSDARAYDGTVSIIQPLIAPLFNGVSPHEVLEAMTGTSARSAYEIVHQTWATKDTGAGSNQSNSSAAVAAGATDSVVGWEQMLRDGIVSNTAFPPKVVAARADLLNSIAIGTNRSDPRSVESC